MRSVMTRVLPVPAPAMTRSGPSPWVDGAALGVVELEGAGFEWGDVEKRGIHINRLAEIGAKRKRRREAGCESLVKSFLGRAAELPAISAGIFCRRRRRR